MLIGVTIGLIAGVLAAARRDSVFDYASSTVVLIGVSIPTFWLGLILIIIFGVWLQWLPISGRVNPRLGADPSALPDPDVAGAWQLGDLQGCAEAHHPAGVDAGRLAGGDHRPHDPRLADRGAGSGLHPHGAGKGLTERRVVRGHAFRNALIPIVTVVGLEFGGLLGGAVVTETVFAWPGVGKLTVDAIARAITR